MPIEITLVFLTSLVVTLTAAVTALAINYYRVTKQLARLERGRKDMRQKLYEQSLTLWDKAHKESLTIIEQAEQEASRILAEANTLKEQTRATLSAQIQNLTQKQKVSLQKVARELLASYQQLLETIRDDDVEILNTISERIVKDTKSGMADLRKTLVEESLHAEKVIQQKIDHELEKIEKDMQIYRANRMAQIDEDVDTLVKRIAKDVLAKSLTERDHQEIIREALDKAKKEGFFAP